MAYTIEKKSDVLYSATITAEPEKLEKEIESIAKAIGKSAKLPGFRPGKAPISIIKRHFADTIKEELVRHIVPEELNRLIEEEKLKLISEPVIEELNYSEPEKRFECRVAFEVKPEIELKPEDYRGIKIKKTTRKITDEDVEKVIQSIRNREAKFNEVDREAKEGDLVELEYTVKVDDKEPEGPKKIAVILGEKQLWPEVEAVVLGKRKGDEEEVSFVAPEDRSVYGEVAGKKVDLKFKVLSVKEKELQELNDEFAKRHGSESLEKMRQEIKEELELSEKLKEEEEVEDQIIDTLLSKVNIPVPQSMLNVEIRAQAENQVRRLAQFGVNVKQINPQTVLDMVKPTAEKTVKVKLLLEKIAELENIEVTDEDLDEEIKKLADTAFKGDYVLARKSLEEKNLIPMIKQDVLRQKALDRLIELADIEEAETSEEGGKD